MDKLLFSGSEIIRKFEELIDIHRGLKTIGMIFFEFDFENDNGNAFQGKVQKIWFKSVIDEMIMTQFAKLNEIVDIYTQEQEKLDL